MKFKEKLDKPKKYKEKYLDGIKSIIEKREKELESVRCEYTKDIFANPEKYRNDLIEMLGWPLTEKRENVPKVKEEFLADEGEFSIYRMRFEVLDGLYLTGLFFKHNDAKTRPLVIAQHGGQGTPEHVADINEVGTCNYNYMIDRIMKYDVNVFAPQLLLWFTETYGVEYTRHEIDAKLKRVGGSITALEIYGIQRILDYFEVQNYVSNFGMIGLSYGGFYTLFTTAADTRIKSAISCSFFNDRKMYPWSDWTWFNSAKMFNDAEIAALVYPRRLCIEVGDKDELFDGKFAAVEFERLKSLCGEVGCEWLDFILFDGTHEFHKGDKPIERLVKDIL